MASNKYSGCSSSGAGNGNGMSALFFTFDLNKGCLHVVNESNFNILEVIIEMNEVKLIGIDTETRPTRRVGEFNPTSIIQMAFRMTTGYEHVIIVDLLSLKRNTKLMKRFDELLAPLFASKTIYKLGQGLVGDFKLLQKSYPTVNAFSTCNAILDTNVFMKRMFPEPKKDYSLKHITNHFLHFDLNKSQQMSDWAKRPLSVKQVQYAACDALVLLRLYDEMTFFHAERNKGARKRTESDVETLFGLASDEPENVPKFDIKSILLSHSPQKVVIGKKRSLHEVDDAINCDKRRLETVGDAVKGNDFEISAVPQVIMKATKLKGKSQ